MPLTFEAVPRGLMGQHLGQGRKAERMEETARVQFVYSYALGKGIICRMF